jgi:uncharacterized membrane protein
MSNTHEKSKQNEQFLRVWEIDALRGLALVLMILYHAAFLARMMLVTDISIFELHWRVIARTASTLFLVLVGVSLVLSYQKAQLVSISKQCWQRKQLVRSAQIFGWGMVISLITLWAVPQFPIVFGVLHLIGVGSVLSLPLVAYPRLALAAALCAAASAPVITTTSAWTAYWIWLGRTPAGFQSLDFWPVLPWIGVLWFGIFLGHIFFRKLQRTYAWRRRPTALEQTLERLGRNSLLIYLLHAPILIVFLWFLKIL